MASLPRGWWLAVLAVEFYLVLVSLLAWARMRSEPTATDRAARTAALIWTAGSAALGLCFVAFASSTAWSRATAAGGAFLLILMMLAMVSRTFRTPPPSPPPSGEGS